MKTLDYYVRNALRSLQMLHDAAHIDAVNHALNTSYRREAAILSSIAKVAIDRLEPYAKR